MLELGLEAVHGRGLAIVAALAHENGVTRPIGRPGKTVWACRRLPVRATESVSVVVDR